jgi:hypothetical protein
VITLIDVPLDFESLGRSDQTAIQPATLPENQGREPLTAIGALELLDNFGE